MKQTQKGFTLVELAIVMTIIGLLIGGILKGQELMENARVTATLSQVKAFESATTSFRDKYDSFPGDMPNAITRLPGCTVGVACENTVALGAGNGIVGDPAWNFEVAQVTAATTSTQAGEVVFFWRHLFASDLITGVTTENVAPAWGTTQPAARIGGGFWVGNGNGTEQPISNTSAVRLNGLVLALVQVPGQAVAAGGPHPLTPVRAAQMDRKIDDGFAGNGTVQAGGVAAGATGCFPAGATFPNALYNEVNTAKACTLYFELQG